MKTHIPKSTRSTQLSEKRKGTSLAPPPFQGKENKSGNTVQSIQQYRKHDLITPTMQFSLQSVASLQPPPIQLTKSGKWWGSTIGGALGGLAGAATGYAYGTLSAATGAITGGISDAVTGYQHGGLRSAFVEGVSGLATGALSGMSSGWYHGGSVGMTLGSAIGGQIGDYVTGHEAAVQPDGPLAQRMRANLGKLAAVEPTLDHAIAQEPKVAPVAGGMHSNEIKLLNWMHEALGADNFNKVSQGAQVRVPFHQELFDRLIGVGAKKRPSSHYSGTLFVSGFRQVVGEQYGTAGTYLPTVLFGKIEDREGNFWMYLQPERNAFNDDTSPEERNAHRWDAFNYAVYGVQQGPHGTSPHTDANPITDHPYTRTLSDFGGSRIMDFNAFIANFVYTNGGMSKVALETSQGKALAIEILTKAGLYGLAYITWKKLGSPLASIALTKIMG
jgi:outer membrane lipoprotein SlyB